MATVNRPEPVAQRKSSAKGQAPMLPEPDSGVVPKRKRLAKVFKRPLDKTLRASSLVREKFSLPEGEFDQLIGMKQRMSELGVPVKKSELVRAGLLQLAALDENTLKAVLLNIQRLG